MMPASLLTISKCSSSYRTVNGIGSGKISSDSSCSIRTSTTSPAGYLDANVHALSIKHDTLLRQLNFGQKLTRHQQPPLKHGLQQPAIFLFGHRVDNRRIILAHSLRRKTFLLRTYSISATCCLALAVRATTKK